MKFTDQIAQYIQRENLDLRALTVVLPSERSKKYLRASLFKQYGKPIISPALITMNDWVQKNSEFTVIDQTRALIQLFEIQLKQAKTEEDRSFDEFINWGNILISDYNEIDQYLLDANEVFKNLTEIKALESWTLSDEPLSSAQLKFMEFWDKLGQFYEEFHKRLESKQTTTSGMAFRKLSENIAKLFQERDDAQFLFAGFNALSPAETSIIKQLKSLGRAHILIDADNYYLTDQKHEAGTFIRQFTSELQIPEIEFIKKSIGNNELKINYIECAQLTGQVKAASTILESMTGEELDDTLLLLADEKLISSVITNLPSNIQKANISLGLPIKNSSVRTWVELMFSIQENQTRFKTSALYYRDFQRLITHPFFTSILDKNEEKIISETEHRITKYNNIFLSRKIFPEENNAQKIVNRLMEGWQGDWIVAVGAFRELNNQIYKQLNPKHAFERSLLECFESALKEFNNLLNEGIPDMSMSSFKGLFNQHWQGKSVAYHGNPMDGLQIMGLLESRTLDFKKIIAIGMNEGNLPPTNIIQTIIPIDLRRYLGLTTPRNKQGIFAHHFYRLLHNCEELTAIYTNASEQIGSNEPSRYLAQLELELFENHESVELNKSVYSLTAEAIPDHFEFKKTENILKRMDVLFARSTSASTIKKYLDCPLDFYFRYVMEFGESDSIEEEIESNTFGTFIHHTLEVLYTPFARRNKKGAIVSPAPSNLGIEDVKRMLKDYLPILDNTFLEHFNGDKKAFSNGKNRLSYEMAKTLVERFLKSEIDFIARQSDPLFIESLERNIKKEIQLEIHGESKLITLNGFIDRIDSIGDKIRIVDYKSGKVRKEDVSLRKRDIEIGEIVDSFGKRKHVLQMMLYAYLYYSEEQKVGEPGIVSLISKNNEFLALETNAVSLEQIIADFPAYLARVFEDIYDQQSTFDHVDKGEFSYCKYCE